MFGYTAEIIKLLQVHSVKRLDFSTNILSSTIAMTVVLELGMLDDLAWQTLAERRTHVRLNMMSKIIDVRVAINKQIT